MSHLFGRFRNLLDDYLSPEDSLLEVVGGVILVLATANTIVVTRDRAGEDQIIRAAFAVAVAWGMVDVGLGLLDTVYHHKRIERTIRDASEADEATGAAIISAWLEDDLLQISTPEEREALVRQLTDRTRVVTPSRPMLTKSDFIGGALTLMLMFAATLPLTIPLFFLDNPDSGVAAMNVMAFVFLFVIGYLWADYTTIKRYKLGLALASVALALTVVAIVFG